MTVRAGRAINMAMANEQPLRRGWTTGACATAAAKAAYTALLTGASPDPVEITLPGGRNVAFALAETGKTPDAASAGVVKDAGDDPDVTHGALIRVTVRRAPDRAGIRFHAGPGVGTVTRPGLPVPPGEPAINPVPRKMITAALEQVAREVGVAADVDVEISIPGGEALAQQTLNPRLGIVGGLSILGTTGVVVPYSCSAWIHGIRNGIDVARAAGLGHVAGATGRTSEAAVQARYDLPDIALIDMGDFVGGMLKHLRAHPIARLSIAGGVAKITKLAQGRLDLHSKRGSADLTELARVAVDAGAAAELGPRIAAANTVAEAFDLARAHGLDLGERIARQARQVALETLSGAAVDVEVLIYDREGALVACAGFAGGDHDAASDRNRRA